MPSPVEQSLTTAGYMESIREMADRNQSWSMKTNNGSSLHLFPPDKVSLAARDLPEYKAGVMVLKFGLPIIVLAGSIGNITALLVLMRRRMRGTSVCFYLAMLAIADTLVLYLSAFKTWMRMMTGFEMLHASNIMCKITIFILLVSWHMSAWLVVAMTVDRFVAVWFPLKVSQICNVSKAKVISTVLLLLMMLINVHSLWTMNLQLTPQKRCAADVEDSFMTHVYPYIKLMSYSIVPFIIVLSLNISIIYRLWQNRSVFEESQQQLQGLRVSRRSQNRVTIMLLSVSIAWLILTAPFMLWSLVTPTSNDLHIQANIFLFKAICFILMYTNHSINFFIYCITGKRFRQEIQDMLCTRGIQQQGAWNTSGRVSKTVTTKASTKISLTSLKSPKRSGSADGKSLQSMVNL